MPENKQVPFTVASIIGVAAASFNGGGLSHTRYNNDNTVANTWTSTGLDDLLLDIGQLFPGHTQWDSTRDEWIEFRNAYYCWDDNCSTGLGCSDCCSACAVGPWTTEYNTIPTTQLDEWQTSVDALLTTINSLGFTGISMPFWKDGTDDVNNLGYLDGKLQFMAKKIADRNKVGNNLKVHLYPAYQWRDSDGVTTTVEYKNFAISQLGEIVGTDTNLDSNKTLWSPLMPQNEYFRAGAFTDTYNWPVWSDTWWDFGYEWEWHEVLDVVDAHSATWDDAWNFNTNSDTRFFGTDSNSYFELYYENRTAQKACFFPLASETFEYYDDADISDYWYKNFKDNYYRLKQETHGENGICRKELISDCVAEDGNSTIYYVGGERVIDWCRGFDGTIESVPVCYYSSDSNISTQYTLKPTLCCPYIWDIDMVSTNLNWYVELEYYFFIDQYYFLNCMDKDVTCTNQSTNDVLENSWGCTEYPKLVECVDNDTSLVVECCQQTSGAANCNLNNCTWFNGVSNQQSLYYCDYWNGSAIRDVDCSDSAAEYFCCMTDEFYDWYTLPIANFMTFGASNYVFTCAYSDIEACYYRDVRTGEVYDEFSTSTAAGNLNIPVDVSPYHDICSYDFVTRTVGTYGEYY